MNIREFLQAAVDGLVAWYLIHYDRATWIDAWVGVKDIEKYFETCDGTLSNGYFYFNWEQAAYRRMAREVLRDKPIDKLAAWLKKNKRPIPAKYLWDSLYEEGFDTFCDGTHPRTDKIKDEVLQCLKQVSDAGDFSGQLDAATWGLHIMHVYGYIAKDYGHIPFEWLHRVQQYGIQSMFGENDLQKFLGGGYPRLTIKEEMLNLMGLRAMDGKKTAEVD